VASARNDLEPQKEFMIRFVKVMKEEDLPIGKSAIIMAGEEEIALFNYKGDYYAVANKCPHKGGPLGEGRVQEGIIVCPNHEWRFDIKNGDNMQNPELSIKSYPVRVRNEKIYIGFKKLDTSPPGTDPSKLPSAIQFNISTIQKPINPDEEL
jgi:nitrite reductase (NADH) small subunit/3-phenylpropionate/trans-cinnamate dioxygenase ferredoxin subunit